MHIAKATCGTAKKGGGGLMMITYAITLTGCRGVLDSILMKTWESGLFIYLFIILKSEHSSSLLAGICPT